MDVSRDWQWIRRIASKIRARHVPVREKRNKMVGDDELYGLGVTLMREADKQSTDRLLDLLVESQVHDVGRTQGHARRRRGCA